MQRLVLRENLKHIIEKLKTERILTFFRLNTIDQKQANNLSSLIIQSKSAYDNMGDEYLDILDIYGIKRVYELDNYQHLSDSVHRIKAGNPNNVMNIMTYKSNTYIVDLYVLHSSLFNSFQAIDKLLIPQNNIFNHNSVQVNYENAEKEGILILQIVNNSHITLNDLNKTINSISEFLGLIIEVLTKLFPNLIISQPSVILIDSGSDTNVWIKITDNFLDKANDWNVMKYISDAISTVWKDYKNKKIHVIDVKQKVSDGENNIIRDNIKLIEEIKNSTLDEKEKLLLSNKVFNKTINVIDNGVLSRKDVNTETVKSSRDILIERQKPKEISEGQKSLPNHEEG